METSITSETISQQTICGDNEGLNLNTNVNDNKEQTTFRKMWNNLNKAREIYFKYFSLQKMACTKAIIQKQAMMGKPLVPSSCGKSVGKPAGKKSGMGKIPWIGVKRLDNIQPKVTTKVTKRRRFRPGMKALHEICQFKKLTELLIPKLPFLWLVQEILQWEHGFHLIQVGAVLEPHEATEVYIIWLMEDTNLCAIYEVWDMRLARGIQGKAVK